MYRNTIGKESDEESQIKNLYPLLEEEQKSSIHNECFTEL